MEKLTRENFSDLPFMISDGAWGTEILKQGGDLGEFLPLWNVRHPEVVRGVARACVEAGSKAILTNTFLADPISMQRNNLQPQMEAVNEAAVAISADAAADRAWVFGSIGQAGSITEGRFQTRNTSAASST